MSMWSDKLILAGLQEHRGASGVLPIAWVPDDRLEAFGPISSGQVQPASLDVRLGSHFILHPSGEEVKTESHLPFSLLPGQCLLGTLVERFAIPDNVVAEVKGKSSWARKFLTVQEAGYIDPGFVGDITLELKNDGQELLEIWPGAPIAQVSFQWLAAPAVRPYGTRGLESHYQHQEGTTPAWD